MVFITKELLVDVPKKFLDKPNFKGFFFPTKELYPYYSDFHQLPDNLYLVLTSKTFKKDVGRIKAKETEEELDYFFDWIKDNPKLVKKILKKVKK